MLLQEELNELRAKDLYRSLRTLKPIDSTHASCDGRELLLFCGNDYLGLSHHRRVIDAAKKAAEYSGVGAGAARLISGTSDLHTEFEEKIARFKNKQRALVFSAGYLANLGVLTALAGEKDLILLDKLCHASLIDGARLSGAALRVFPHKNYQKGEEILQASAELRRRILVTDSIFSMDGDLADLAELVRLKEKYDCLLVVDDAHGTGVLGLNGRGAAEDENLEEKIDVMTGTLSKTLGCLGGFAAASEDIIDYLINTSRPFIFATALPPMICAGALEALHIIEELPELRYQLWRNIQRMHSGLAASGFETGPIQSPIFPVGIGSEKEALEISEQLLNQGILVPAVRYPTVPKGKARLRVTVSAAHSDEEIERFIGALALCRQNR